LMVLVVRNLKRHPHSKISLPNNQQKQEYANMVHHREPRVHNCIII